MTGAASAVPLRVIGVAAIAPGVALLSWWLIGDLSRTDLFSPDYFIKPASLSEGQERLLGLAGVLLLLLAIGLVGFSHRWSPVRRDIYLASLLCFVLGLGLGGGYRVVTTGGSGAAFGPALTFLALIPTCLSLIVYVTVLTVRDIHRAREVD